ncbi:SDR family NAD(P)-dependent oxidoreductase [Pigmentiphaga sp. YJ18]|uniref:SDR family NAD(P)-dependent oxidoreductase n=1 Tax=Pigmentiphaga sp. YJ18 TaxID=3134907 RepID=UPI0031122A87
MNASLWNTMGLDGRTALVTGAGKGLGRAIAMGLAQAGANVALLARTARDVEAACEEIRATGARALPLAADATDSAQVDRAVSAVLDEFGTLDILVHSAGGSQRKPVLELADDEWKRLIGANLDSTFYVCRAAGRAMHAQGRGSIINIASAAGLRGRPNNSPYSAAKAAMINFSRALAMEWAPQGIRVNTLAPGRFLTPLTEAEMSDPAKHAAFVRNVPLGRIGRPEELKEIVVWLASDASAFVTGSTIVIDGGQTLL